MRMFVGIGLPPYCRRAIFEAVSPLMGRRRSARKTLKNDGGD